jgi:YgiT-type zinc finger domain-containing protein
MGIKCGECSGHMKETELVQYEAGAVFGLKRVHLRHVSALVCDRCGSVMLPGSVLDRVQETLATWIAQHVEDLTPASFRFLRKHFAMTQAALANRLGVTRLTVHRWESGVVPIGRTGSIAMRTFVLLPGLRRAASVPRRRVRIAEKPGSLQIEATP